ncbi:hypothetical protein HHI36_003113 [Cryptolaemus montrouzieri]|uniref:Uncharacterized protein n=1 Tax=Cryptolaemus montrouzieri TaxID=559131 RepID=A0ABD2PE02_9CUCU
MCKLHERFPSILPGKKMSLEENSRNTNDGSHRGSNLTAGNGNQISSNVDDSSPKRQDMNNRSGACNLLHQNIQSLKNKIFDYGIFLSSLDVKPGIPFSRSLTPKIKACEFSCSVHRGGTTRSFSRHNAQMLTILKKPSETKETGTKDTKKNRMRIFPTSKLDYVTDQLRNMGWSEITNSKEVNRAYGWFLDRMKTLIDKIFSFKTIQQHDIKSWITQGIRISARRKNVVYHLKIQQDITKNIL